jgi:hypothetical protein
VIFRKREKDLHVGESAYDDWEVVRDFEDMESATAWRDHLRTAGIKAVLTADWPLDEFHRGDIALRVESADWSEAEAFLSNLE